jgi:hypothetical protein
MTKDNQGCAVFDILRFTNPLNKKAGTPPYFGGVPALREMPTISESGRIKK